MKGALRLRRAVLIPDSVKTLNKVEITNIKCFEFRSQESVMVFGDSARVEIFDYFPERAKESRRLTQGLVLKKRLELVDSHHITRFVVDIKTSSLFFGRVTFKYPCTRRSNAKRCLPRCNKKTGST